MQTSQSKQFSAVGHVNGRLHLEPTVGLPRQLIIAKTARTWMVSLNFPGCHFQAVFAVSESLRMTRTSGTPVLWVGDAAFDLTDFEARQISSFAGIAYPAVPSLPGARRLPATPGSLVDVHA